MDGSDRLVRLLTALGADDPAGWARSEAEEDVPQLARYRLLRALRAAIESWDEDAVIALRDDQDAEAAVAVAQAFQAGLSAEALSRIARLVAHETAFSLLYQLADPDGDDLSPDLRAELPGWRLVETAPDGRPTGRVLDDLHEDLLSTAPARELPLHAVVAEGWVRDVNVRPLCESLATEVGYDFDDSDWMAIESSLADTDDEQPPEYWYTYPIVGRRSIGVRMARSVEGSEVSVKIEGAVGEDERNRIAALLAVMARYSLTQ